MAALNTQQEAHLRRRPSLLASMASMATIFALTIISASVYALLVVAPASDAATPRVLAIRFGPDLEVNRSRRTTSTTSSATRRSTTTPW